jgi:DNA-binding IscR family transcriptional regulator
MKRGSRLSGVLHALLHMAARGVPMTSEELARAMHTNPVVVRRLLAGLRNAGFVASERGHGGGWMIGCDLAKITLRDIYDAVGSPYPFALASKTEPPGCVVERAVNNAVDGALRDAHDLLLARFSAITLAEIAGDAKHHGL